MIFFNFSSCTLWRRCRKIRLLKASLIPNHNFLGMQSGRGKGNWLFGKDYFGDWQCPACPPSPVCPNSPNTLGNWWIWFKVNPHPKELWIHNFLFYFTRYWLSLWRTFSWELLELITSNLFQGFNLGLNKKNFQTKIFRTIFFNVMASGGFYSSISINTLQYRDKISVYLQRHFSFLFRETLHSLLPSLFDPP